MFDLENFFNGKYQLKVDQDEDGTVHINYSFKDNMNEGCIDGCGKCLSEAMDNIIEETAKWAEQQEQKDEEECNYEDLSFEELVELHQEKDKFISKLLDENNDFEALVTERDNLIERVQELEEIIDDNNITIEQQKKAIRHYKKYLGILDYLGMMRRD